MYYDGGNIELDGAIYCGWFVALTLPPDGVEWKAAFRWMDHALRWWGLTVSYIGNRYYC